MIKLEWEMIKDVFKKNKIWLTIYLMFIFIETLIIILRPIMVPVTDPDFLSLIGHPLYYDYNFTTILLKIFQVCLIIYYAYQVNTYEYQSSIDLFLLRLEERKWFKVKLLSLIFLFSSFEFIFITFLAAFFMPYFSLKFSIYFDILLYDLNIVLLTITITNCLFNSKTSLLVLFIMLLAYLMLIFFNVYFLLAMIIVQMLINLYFFRFKKILK